MAGSLRALLQGLTLPAQNAPQWDHTYVTSSCGYGPWECFGRSSGGFALASGTGNSFVAECHSYPRRNNPYLGLLVYAGIDYLVTGVCHQAANRILSPAGALVSKARGYGVSRALYGPYGTDGWPEQYECEHVNSTQSVERVIRRDLRVASQYGLTRSDNPMNSYDSVAIATAGAPGNNFDEMAAFFREQLPHPPSDKILHQLFEIEVDLRKKQINLAKQRRSREISDKEYAGRLTEALDFWKNETRRLLGEEDFDHVYGAAGHSPESIIDPANFQV